MNRSTLLRLVGSAPFLSVLKPAPRLEATISDAAGAVLERYSYSRDSALVLLREAADATNKFGVGTVVKFSEPLGKYGVSLLRKASYGMEFKASRVIEAGFDEREFGVSVP